MPLHQRLGFMQGRLSPLVDGKIQAFPERDWAQEFPAAQVIGLPLMEWTMDQAGILENPLMTEPGRARIRALCAAHGVAVRSLTGDFCMHAPFWKQTGAARAALAALFGQVVEACAKAEAGIIVVPLVDGGSLASTAERDALSSEMLKLQPLLARLNVRVCFESDLAPAPLAAFIADFPAAQFGINYDMGNSASLGWDPREEIPMLAPRILNVHIKDRVLGGSTVPLGTGAAQLPLQFTLLREAGYAGNYILQTARAQDGDHAGALRTYAALALGLLEDGSGA